MGERSRFRASSAYERVSWCACEQPGPSFGARQSMRGVRYTQTRSLAVGARDRVYSLDGNTFERFPTISCSAGEKRLRNSSVVMWYCFSSSPMTAMRRSS